MPLALVGIAAAGIGAATAAGAFTPDTPDARNISAEKRDTLQAQIDLAPARYAATAEYDPKYAELQRSIQRDQLLGTGENDPGQLAMLREIMPQLQAMQDEATLAQRTSDISAVESLGPRATAAFRAANPEQARLLDELNAGLTEDLAAGGELTPFERRQVEQATRAGQAARGMGVGPVDTFEEALNKTLATRSYKANLRSQGMALAGVNQATSADPFLAILGRSSTASNASQNLLGSAGATGTTAGQFDPLNSYASDLYNTNYNAQAAANIAGANANAGMASGLFSGLSGIGGSWLKSNAMSGSGGWY